MLIKLEVSKKLVKNRASKLLLLEAPMQMMIASISIALGKS